MKLRNLFLGGIMCSALAVFAACEQENATNLGSPALSVSETELAFEEAGGDKSVILNSTRDWKVTSSAEWVKVDPASGEASAEDQTVVVSALANEGGNRNATLTFTIGMVSKTVKVSQVGTGVTPPEEGITPIADVLKATAALPAGTTIKGVVISNLELNNLTSKKGLYVQDETGGLQFYLAANHSLAVGTEVKIDLGGVTLGAYNGAVQISGLALDKITTVSTGNALVAKTVTVADFLANKYEGQYVALEGVQVASSDLSKTWSTTDSHTSINMEDVNGKKFVVFSSKYATYGAETVAQGSGTIKGIASINNGNLQIIFAQASDYAGLTGERFTASAGGNDNTGGDNTGGDNTGGDNTDSDVVSIQTFLAAPVSADVFYTVTGTIAVIEEMSSQYHNANMTITDGTGNLYVYRVKSTNGTNIESLGLNVGDEITIKGNRGDYNGMAQMTNGVYVSHVDHEAPADNYNASIVFSEKGYANGESVDGQTIVIDDVVSCVFSKAAANNAPAYYTSGSAIRMYQNGATLDITATGGKTIKKIEFSFGSNMYYLTCDSGTLSAEGPVRTWEGSATSVKFTANGTTSSTRAYVASIKVQYE